MKQVLLARFRVAEQKTVQGALFFSSVGEQVPPVLGAERSLLCQKDVVLCTPPSMKGLRGQWFGENGSLMGPTQGEGRVSSAGSGRVAPVRGGFICIYRQDLLSDAVLGGGGSCGRIILSD